MKFNLAWKPFCFHCFHILLHLRLTTTASAPYWSTNCLFVISNSLFLNPYFDLMSRCRYYYQTLWKSTGEESSRGPVKIKNSYTRHWDSFWAGTIYEQVCPTWMPSIIRQPPSRGIRPVLIIELGIYGVPGPALASARCTRITIYGAFQVGYGYPSNSPQTVHRYCTTSRYSQSTRLLCVSLCDTGYSAQHWSWSLSTTLYPTI